jgi:2-keto-3-deoxy-L-rhamnonate aldolase RhmA
MSHNPIISGLAAAKAQFGLFCCSHSVQVAEALAGSNFQFLIFDLEHCPQSLPHLHAQLAALNGSGIGTIVRATGLDKAAFKQYLDLGVHAIMVPSVSSADEARQAMRFMSYPPLGVRGVGGSVRVTRYGRDKGYLQRAGEETCLIVQIETVAGVERLDEICGVEGVRAVFFGPHDLAADMGYLGQSGHPAVTDAILAGIRAARARGLGAGILAPEADCGPYLEAGANLVCTGSDLGLLVSSADALAARLANRR